MIALKMTFASPEKAKEHYGKDDEWCTAKGEKWVAKLIENGQPVMMNPVEYGRAIVDALLDFLTASPVVAMVFEGNQAVGIVKKLIGGTEPLTSDVGTIRGDLTLDSYDLANFDSRAVRNLIHCSDAVDEAMREMAIWFTPEEIVSYRSIQETMLYDVNFDGLKE